MQSASCAKNISRQQNSMIIAFKEPIFSMDTAIHITPRLCIETINDATNNVQQSAKLNPNDPISSKGNIER